MQTLLVSPEQKTRRYTNGCTCATRGLVSTPRSRTRISGPTRITHVTQSDVEHESRRRSATADVSAPLTLGHNKRVVTRTGSIASADRDRSGDARTPQSAAVPGHLEEGAALRPLPAVVRSPPTSSERGATTRSAVSANRAVAVTQSPPRALLESVSFFDVFSSCRPLLSFPSWMHGYRVGEVGLP